MNKKNVPTNAFYIEKASYFGVLCIKESPQWFKKVPTNAIYIDNVSYFGVSCIKERPN